MKPPQNNFIRKSYARNFSKIETLIDLQKDQFFGVT